MGPGSRSAAGWPAAKGAALAALAAVAVFAGTTRGGFVYDDWPIVVENPLVTTASGPAAWLGSDYWQRGGVVHARGGLYRPLTVASLAVNARLSGLRPAAFHAVNVALHAADSAMACLLAAALGMTAAAATLCGLCFAVIPIHCEAVAWVAGRAELLAAFFALLSWLCVTRASSTWRIAAGAGFYAAALLSKESAAALPAAVVLSDFAGTSESWREVTRRRWGAWLVLAAVAGLYLEWRALVLGGALPGRAPYFAGAALPVRLLTMSRFFARGWLAPMASGLGLCADYSHPVFPDSSPKDAGAWLLTAAMAGGAIIAAADFSRRRRFISLGPLVLLALAAPVSNLAVQMEVIGAERIMYLPSLGFALLVGGLWDEASPRRRAQPAAAAAAAALFWWSILSLRRDAVWRSDASLWTQTAACAAGSPRVLLALGQLSAEAGRHAEAIADFRRALALDPALAEAKYAEAKSLFDSGDSAGSEAALVEATRRWPPGDRAAWCLLGVVAETRGETARALDAYRRAVAADPRYALARRDLGLLLYRTGDHRGALEQLLRYLELAPPEDDAREIRVFLRAAYGRTS